MATAHTKGAGRENLREKLRRYRLEQARRDGVPPYFVFWNSTLDQLCEELPRDGEALSDIHRFGGQETRDKYGEDVLEIIDGWVEERLDKGLPLMLTTTSAHQQGEYLTHKFSVPKDPSETFFGGMLGDSPWTRILWDLYESFCGSNRKATKKHIGDRTGYRTDRTGKVWGVLSRMKELDFFDEDALREGKYMLDPTKPKVGSLIFSLAELEGGHRSQEVKHRIKHLMKHRRRSKPDILVKIGDREIEMDAKKLIGFSPQIDSAIQKEMFDEVDSRDFLLKLQTQRESIQEMKDEWNKPSDFSSQMRNQIEVSKAAFSEYSSRLRDDLSRSEELLSEEQITFLEVQWEKQKTQVEQQMVNLVRLQKIVDTWQDENTRISTDDAIALTTQVLIEFSPDEDDGGPAWVGRADLFEQMKQKGFNGSSSRFSQILTKMVERETISRRPTREQGGREYRMRPDLWMMHRLLMEGLDVPSISSTPGHRPPI